MSSQVKRSFFSKHTTRRRVLFLIVATPVALVLLLFLLVGLAIYFRPAPKWNIGGWTVQRLGGRKGKLEISAQGIHFLLRDDEYLETYKGAVLNIQNRKRSIKQELRPPMYLSHGTGSSRNETTGFNPAIAARSVSAIKKAELAVCHRERFDFSDSSTRSPLHFYSFGLKSVKDTTGIWNMRVDVMVKGSTEFVVTTCGKEKLWDNPGLPLLVKRVKVE